MHSESSSSDEEAASYTFMQRLELVRNHRGRNKGYAVKDVVAFRW